MSQRRSAWLHACVLVAALANCTPADAAGECLAKPNRTASPGEHWYYRYDGATKRRCWHLGEETGRPSRNTTTDASLDAPDAPAAQSPIEPPAAPAPAPTGKASADEPGREAIETIAAAVPPETAGGQAELARTAGLLPWPDDTSWPSASPSPTAAADGQATSSTTAPPQPASEIAPEAAEPPPQFEALAMTPAASDIGRHLVALVLAALALLLVAKPISQVVHNRFGRTAVRRRVEQAPLSDTDVATVSIREILGRCDQTTETPAIPRSDVPAWPREIAQALQRLNGATEAYREGVRVRTPTRDVRASG